MNRRATVLAPGVLAAALLVAGPSSAGPEKITFPANWASYTLYTTVDRPDIKQYPEFYASTPAAVEAMQAGKSVSTQ